jgi:death-on-curing protein
MADIIWLLEEAVLTIHQRQIAEYGGSGGLRDQGLLTSAIARPQQLLAYGQPAPDLASLAAAYAYGIARNHPFIDGNKRTALVAARTFLLLNGANVQAAQVDKWLTFLRLAEGSLTEDALGEWIRKRICEEI